MAAFIEPLLQERLWHWLETEKDMTVAGEMRVENGRIDLAAKTPDGRTIGIEVKSGSGVGFGKELYEQLHRYIESGAFDEIYFASQSVDPVLHHLRTDPKPDMSTLNQASKQIRSAIQSGECSLEEAKARIEAEVPQDLLERPRSGRWGSVKSYVFDKIEREDHESDESASLDDGIRYLCRARCPTKIGVIHVPVNHVVKDGQEKLRELNRVHDPEQAYEPISHREAEQLERSRELQFNSSTESWVRHYVWQQYGGLPEGYLPNVRSSDQPYRPIDLVTFEGSHDPSAILESGEGRVVGVEAKGNRSFDTERLPRQLSDFLSTNSLTHLYLAVPTSLRSRAKRLLDEHDNENRVGLLVVGEEGDVQTVRDAPRLSYEHDGYLRRYSPQKIGYGNVSIEGGGDVRSPYVTEEEAQRLKYSDATEYASKLLTDNSDLADDGWIRNDPPTTTHPPESEFETDDTARAYLLRGSSAAPYLGPPRTPKDGYVRLSLTEYAIEETFALKLHFGQGTWEGGYISLVGDQVQILLDVLASLETIEGGMVPGQGKYIDLKTFPFDRDENEPHRVSGSSGEVSPLVLTVESLSDETDAVARLIIGDTETQGIDVTLTEAQRCDLLASIDILRDGNPRELPGEYKSYPRIGPDGDDTWGLGSDVEKAHEPKPLEEW